VTGTRGRQLYLASVSMCNCIAASQPDMESLCLLWATFWPNDNKESKNPTCIGQSNWVLKREIYLGSNICSDRIGVNVGETITKHVKMVKKTIRRTSLSSSTASKKLIYIPRELTRIDEP
jgi:hypothetical protein